MLCKGQIKSFFPGIMGVGRGAGAPGLDFKIIAKKVVFLVSSGKKQT